MFYLKDANGNVVRALEWSGQTLTFVYRHDTGRVESCQDVSYFEEMGIDYTLLETIDKNIFAKSAIHSISQLDGRLRIVREADQLLTNVELPKDDPKKFTAILRNVAAGSVAVAALFAGLAFFITPKETPVEEPQVVQVMDRKQMEKMIVVAPAAQKIVTPRKVVAQKATPQIIKKNVVARQSGVLGVLGSLKSSKQQGGLKLTQADTSAGIGRGGNRGSGGVQTSVYSKGLFSAPLGSGGRVNGAGGYGTKGKGGGQAGYGKVAIVGSGEGFFQPVESEASVEGGLDRNEIAAVIRRHESEVRFCYEQGLQTKPKLNGRLSMKFMIGPKGSVTLAQVMNSSLGNIPVENCIRDRLKTWNFPQPQGGVTVKVSYPFILRRVTDS
ncbi:MAG: AgmX/PglI C-terminal domain-containing protein [Bdellovibrionota bacterium]